MTTITTSLVRSVKSSFFVIGGTLFIPVADPIGVIQMPLYTAITQEGTVSVATQTNNCRIDHPNPHFRDEGADELCPRGLPSYPKGSGFTGGEGALTAALNCVLRSEHTPEEKTGML
jgi:hypothetical protein